MLRFSVGVAFLLAMVFALPMLVIRAMPYHDRINGTLVAENCPAPCFLGIRPGVTTMQQSVYLMQAHPWVANGRNGFPSQVLSAVFYDAGLPITVIDIRWADSAPQWIDRMQRSAVTVEDREVLNLALGTHLSLGEIMLAFGAPDESWYIAANGRSYEFIAWYATERMLITTEGSCPLWHSYSVPVQISFRPTAPRFYENSALRSTLC